MKSKKTLTNEQKKACSKVVLDFILRQVGQLDDAIYEFMPEDIVEDEELMHQVIDEFNVFTERQIIKSAFEIRYGKYED